MCVVLVMLMLATVPRLPRGICFGDSGDLQVASSSLGIMHPPGYAGFTALGYLVTRIPGVDPAYMVSLVCLACGLTGLWVCMLIQIRLGASPWVAGLLVLLLAMHPRVWTNLVVPEVYVPTLAFVVSSAYLLIKHVRTGRPVWLFVAAALFGFAVANRPTVIWTLPFFLLAWWVGARRQACCPRVTGRSIAIVVAMAALPGVFSIGYLWARDAPTTRYNYIEIQNAETQALPPSTAGWRAKSQRVWHHVTARQFSVYMGNTWRGAWNRLVWVYKEFFLYEPVRFAIVSSIIVVGMFIAIGRCPVTALLVSGLAIGNLAFVCTYRIYGMAGDLSALMFAATIFAGVAVSRAARPLDRGWCRGLVVGLVVTAGIGTIWRAPELRVRADLDALPYLGELDVSALPENPLICSTWPQTPPLFYDTLWISQRSDVLIVNAATRFWVDTIRQHAVRPSFVLFKASELENCRVAPYRNIWRVCEPTGCGEDASP